MYMYMHQSLLGQPLCISIFSGVWEYTSASSTCTPRARAWQLRLQQVPGYCQEGGEEQALLKLSNTLHCIYIQKCRSARAISNSLKLSRVYHTCNLVKKKPKCCLVLLENTMREKKGKDSLCYRRIYM